MLELHKEPSSVTCRPAQADARATALPAALRGLLARLARRTPALEAPAGPGRPRGPEGLRPARQAARRGACGLPQRAGPDAGGARRRARRARIRDRPPHRRRRGLRRGAEVGRGPTTTMPASGRWRRPRSTPSRCRCAAPTPVPQSGRPVMADAAFTRPRAAPRRSGSVRPRPRRAGSAALLIGVVVALVAVILFAPLVVVFAEALAKGVAAAAASLDEPDAPLRHRAHAPRRRHRRAAQRGLRHRRRLGDRQVRLPRQGVPHHPHRPAVLGLAGGGRPLPRAGLRRQQRHRRLVRGAGLADHLRGARHRARHHVHHLPVRGARAHPGDAGAGPRRGGGRAHARRLRLAHLPHRDAAQHPLGAALRASFSATPAPWASSAPWRWSRARSAARPTPCR